MTKKREGIVRETQSEKVERVCNQIIARHHYKSILNIKHDEILIYDVLKGIYYDDECVSIRTLSMEILGSQWTVHLQNEIITKVAQKTAVKRSEFDVYPNLLCCANGIVDMDTLEFSSHTPKTLFRRYVNTNYDPDATCPAFENICIRLCSHRKKCY